LINSRGALGASSQTVNITLGGGTFVSAPNSSSSIILSDIYNLPVTANSGIEVSLGTSLVLGGLLDRSGTASALTLRKTGQGTLVLKGNNSFSGIWSVDQGTLQVEDGGNIGVLGASTARVTNNAQLSFKRGDDYDFKSVVSGTGVLSQDGVGALRLLGANTYTGLTLINAGKLIIGDSSTATSVSNPKAWIDPASSVSVGLQGVLELANVRSGNAATGDNLFPNYVTGAGDVRVRYFTGTVLSFGKTGSANNYTGATYVDSGTLKPLSYDAVSRSAGFHVASGAILDLTSLAATGGSFTQTNDKVLGGDGNARC
jgi:autotransporter-associated beta strand protein